MKRQVKVTGSCTDGYLLTMAKAMFSSVFTNGKDALIQWKLVYENPYKHVRVVSGVGARQSEWIRSVRPQALIARDVTLLAVFRSTEGDRRTMATRFEFLLTQDSTTPWDIILTTMWAIDEFKMGGGYRFCFEKPVDGVTPELRELSSRLRESPESLPW